MDHSNVIRSIVDTQGYGLSSEKELFSRLVFNILCGNTDDPARNHAAFWDAVCAKAELNEVDKKLLWERQFLNSYSVEQ